jgi:hypothetical protein
VRAKLRVMVKPVLRKDGYSPDKQEKATQTVLQQSCALIGQPNSRLGPCPHAFVYLTVRARSFWVCAGSRETSFDEGVYVLDRGVFNRLNKIAG